MAIEITPRDHLVIGRDDLDLCLCRCGVDEHSMEPAGGGTPGELEPIHRPVTATDIPRPVHVTPGFYDRPHTEVPGCAPPVGDCA